MHVEQIAAIYAKKIFIIHETISTGAEVGMFAVFPLLASKTCVIYPDSFSIEEDKLGNVIRYAFHMDSRSENYIQVIKYYPDIEVFRFSKNKSDYYNFFHKNEIGIELGNKINSFIMNSPNRKFFFSICRGSFGKISSDNQSVQYTIHGIARELHAYIPPDTLLLHLTALVLMDGSKKELRKAKKIIDHVDYLCKEYKKILQNSINYYDKEILSVYEIKVKLNIPMEISIRQAVGYFLFMLQGIQLIHLDSVNEDDPDIRKVVFSQELLKMEDSLRGIIVEQGETEFVRNVL